MSAPYHGCKHSAQDWFRDGDGKLRCTECEVVAPIGNWYSWVCYVGFAFVVAALLAVAASSVYHAGWNDGFRACEAIYQEVRR